MRNSIAKSACFLTWIFVSCVSINVSISFSQEIVLRDLTRISSVPVRDVSDEILTLSNNQRLTWDLVLQARVDPVWQKQLDQRIERFGLPLYRLKHRLRQKNFGGAYAIAKQWYETGQSFAGDEAAFLVCRSVMLGRIASDERENAVEPMIRALKLQQKCSSTFLESFSHLAFSSQEFKTSLCDDLSPVWNSSEACSRQLDKLDAEFNLNELTGLWPGLAVYLSSMAVHAGQRERMRDWNATMGDVTEFRPWQRMLGANLSRSPLPVLIRDLDGPLRVSTMYWWATAEDQQASKADRVLALLKIVANYKEKYPALSKMALADAIELTDDLEEREILQAGNQ